MSFTSKIKALLFVLALTPSVFGADIGDLKAPLTVKSNFVVRTDEGPPSDRMGINRYAPCYLLKFTTFKYKRDIAFSESGDYIYLRDYYGEYELPSFQTQSLGNFVAFRKQYALNNSWKGDLKGELGKETQDADKGAVQIDIPWEPPKMVQKFIGEGKSNIKVTGTRSISFSGRSEWEDNLVNTGTFKQSKFPTLQMEQKSRFKVTGTVGSKITVEVDQDSQRDVELANTIKLRYKGEEDEILQSIEAGNTNLSLPNASLIGYSQNVQGLFGIKATAKIGNLDLTMITSQEKGTSEKTTFNAGAAERSRPIKDYEYLANTYFWLDVPHDPNTDSLLKVELYVSGTDVNRDPWGIAVVNPNGQLPYVSPQEDTLNEFGYSRFAPYEGGDFTAFDLNKNNWYVVLNKPLYSNNNQVLGAYIEFRRFYPGSSRIDTIKIGNLNYGGQDTAYVLQLLKAAGSNPSFATWNRMWRNVYDLGARDISPDGFELKIYKGTGGNDAQINDVEDLGGQCFITILGLDRKNNETGALTPDCIFDFDNTMIDSYRGHLIFPEPRPFANPALLQDTVPDIYNHNYDQTYFNNVTKYYINVKSAQRSTTFSLGRANIMPNSEVVKLGDGTVLRRDIDYTINYDIGQITFINDQALNAAANVSVDFEYAPFFMPEKKSLFGVAAQYKLWESSNISMAAMYRSESASEPRPRVGREPRRGFVWDSNFSFNFRPEVMTDFVDALPLVEADAPSALEISGEVAQSFPNPNIKNEAFIDDFEGSRNYTDLSTRRGIWTASSAPLDISGARGRLNWYNSFQPLRITDIWPERDIKEQENRIDVMFLKYTPSDSLAAPESSWAGIMRSFYSGLSNQTLSKFIEIWYFPQAVDSTDGLTLNINLGSISEDIDGDGIKDTEDRLTTGAVGTFEPDLEDTGLDGKFDEAEPGYPANPDPSADNWSYDQNNPDEYSHINGTEGNGEDPDRRGRFDTEDINNNTNLDRQNGYFEYTVHLNSPEYVVDSTSTGWKLLRIPLQDSAAYDVRGNNSLVTDFSKIDFARLWFTGARTEQQIVIASIELVGNKWQEYGIVNEADTLDFLRPGEKFEVSIKNTQENANYFPPPGVEGNLNRETGIREKEQSLVLAYENMAPNHDGSAYWNLYSPEDYTQYQRLKMYVYGDTALASGVPDGKVIFYLRLSQDGVNGNFYEYQTVLEPGWSEENWVDIDFAKLTALKYELQRRTAPESLAYADTVDGHYRVHGDPKLSQVKWFIVGVKMAPDAPETATGEVWIDEMRVTEIRRQSDFAGRIQATARFSDFFDLTASYGRTGADFFPLSARVATGATSVSTSARMNMKVEKLLPPSLGLTLPVTVSWQNQLALPRLKPGSDVILQQEAREFEKTRNESFTYSVSQAFNRNTDNWLWNLTLNRIRTSYSFTRTEGISPTSPVNRRETYKGTGAYDLTPKAKPSIKPFFWAKYLLFPAKLYNAQLAYLPTQLSFSGEFNGSKTINVTQRGIATSSRVRDLSLSGNTSLALFPSLRTSYSASSSRDISQPGRFKLSINPSKLKLGQEQSFTQRFETSFQPKIINFIDNRFSFSSNYAENSDFRRSTDSTRTTQVSGIFKTDLTLNLQTLLGSGGNRPATPPRRPERNEIPKDEPGLEDLPEGEAEMPSADDSLRQESSEGQEEGGGGPGAAGWALDRFTGLFRSIKPVRFSYSKDRRLNNQGLLDRPGWDYIFGLTENPHAQIKSTTGLAGPNQSVYSNTYDLDSGIQPFRGLDITTGYTLRNTVTRSSNEPLKAKSITFPEVGVNLSGLEKFALFNKVTNTVGLQTSYSRKVDENGREDTGELYKRDTGKSWAPLAALSITFKNDVRATLRYDLSRNVSQNLREQGQAKRDVYSSDNTIKLTLNYNFSAPQGLKLPLLKKVKFNSQMTLNLDITMKKTKAESLTDGQRSTDSERSQLIVEPRMTYQFSRAITGGIRGRWDDSNDKIQKRKHHIRELGITAEIRF